MTATSAGQTHHEIEIKLDAEAGFALPDLTGLPGVTQVQDAEVQHLEAVYLDSADLHLVRHGSTFRRRTGGTDAGWHLKLPAAKNDRIEVHRAFGRDAQKVPPKLLGLLRVQLRGAQVAPVARISTRRTVRRLLGQDGAVLAEVADDQVTAEAIGDELTTSVWREIEVELIDGDTDLLSAAEAVLLEAGARPSDSSSKLKRALARRLALIQQPDGDAQHCDAQHGDAGAGQQDASAGRVAVAYLAAGLADLIAQDPQVRIDDDDSVHQMRVATRRLRTGLATFRPLFADGTVQQLRDELKWIGALLGVARDAEVIRARLTAELAEQPAELVLGPVQRRIDLELGAAYQAGHAAVLEALDGERYLALVTALEAFTTRPPFSKRGAAPASSELRKRVDRANHRVLVASAGLDAELAPQARDMHLHEVRIAAKRARYAAEAVRPVIGRQAKTLAAVMSEIQETLGEHQDAVVLRHWLRDLATRAFLNGENAFTFGLLHGLTEGRAQHDEERFTRTWARAQAEMARWSA